MIDKNEIVNMKQNFDRLKHVDENGREYWYAHELSKAMGYSEYGKFKPAIGRAMDQMKAVGKNPDEHIAQVSESFISGNRTERKVDGYKLSKLAAYNVAMNADPKKTEVAFAQEYFLQNTAKAEIIQQRIEDKQYISIRSELTEKNRKLAGTLLNHDVPASKIGVVLDAGDKGFFDMGTQEVKNALGVPSNKPLADVLGAEVASYKTTAQFIAERRININNANGVKETSDIVYDSNRAVRELVQHETGEVPENLITGEDVKVVERRYKKQNEALEKALKESPALQNFAEENF
jgi:DNA-damage-inducible protein D